MSILNSLKMAFQALSKDLVIITNKDLLSNRGTAISAEKKQMLSCKFKQIYYMAWACLFCMSALSAN